MSAAPESLETERLLLRRFRPEDRAAYVAIRSQPEVAAALGYAPADGESKTDWFLELDQRSWRERGFGVWLALDKSDGSALGHVGLWYLPPFDAIELLYGYGRAAWGRGLATEAGRRALDVAFGELALTRLIGLATEENRRSRRVLEKLGFVPGRLAEHRGVQVIVHELLAPRVA